MSKNLRPWRLGPAPSWTAMASSGQTRQKVWWRGGDPGLRPGVCLRRRRTPRRPLSESIEKDLCRFEIGRFEPFGKPAIDRLEGCQGVGGTALLAQQPGKARGGAQFEGKHTLPTHPVERLPEEMLGRRRGCGRALQQKELA